MFDFESSIIIQDEFWDKDHWDKWGEYKGIFAAVSIAYGDFDGRSAESAYIREDIPEKSNIGGTHK